MWVIGKGTETHGTKQYQTVSKDRWTRICWVLTSVSMVRKKKNLYFKWCWINWKSKLKKPTVILTSHSTQKLIQITDLNVQSKTTKRKWSRKYPYLKVGSFCRQNTWKKKYKTLNLKLLSPTSLNVKLLLLERYHEKWKHKPYLGTKFSQHNNRRRTWIQKYRRALINLLRIYYKMTKFFCLFKNLFIF